MISAWRIVKEKWRKDAVSGEGAEINGGRWNSPGMPAVYAAGSVSLAMLELIANFSNPNAPSRYVIIEIGFDESLVEIPKAFPPKWNKYPHSTGARQFGDEWIRQARSAVLRVPSALVPMEWNYVMNPRHPQFSHIAIGAPQPVKLDPRIIPATRTR